MDAKDFLTLQRKEALKQHYDLRNSQLENLKQRKNRLKEMLARKRTEESNNRKENLQGDIARVEMHAYMSLTGLQIEPLSEGIL